MKRFMGFLVALILIIQSSFNVNAAEYNNSSIETNENRMDSLETITDIGNQTNGVSDFIIVYDYKYDKGSLKHGAWRNGTSGGSTTSQANLSLNYSNNESYNISFTAAVSGSYTNGGTIGSQLGVTLGKTETHSLGSGYSVTVPKNSHYLIQYRPMYYRYTVVETKYMERYNIGLGRMERYAIGEKICYVNVFSHWDFTHIAN